MNPPLIKIDNCSISSQSRIYIPAITWELKTNETWLITGANGSGKSTLAAALTGKLEIIPRENGMYSNQFKDSIRLVSFETASALIEEERLRDDSDFVEGGIDHGRTPRNLLPAGTPDDDPVILQCGIQAFLDRGLKYLSTGEIRRTLLAVALLEKPALLILDEPFDGLDIQSKEILVQLLEKKANDSLNDLHTTGILLLLDRFDHIPSGITHVLELKDHYVSFYGTRPEYEKHKDAQAKDDAQSLRFSESELNQQLLAAREQGNRNLPDSTRTRDKILIDMKNVTVEWSERKVLENLSWTLVQGEHWLIRGPNGSGKTTFLELITGDNPQVFRNDIWLFGNKRGSGETIWEIKEKLGIVSYRLHLEYRIFGDFALENVILSGLHDSIGLYQQCGEVERELAHKWLTLTGFAERGTILFRDLSYGEQRAVIIARAAVKSPPILILDEPCHGLDENNRRNILTLLEAIAESGSSTLLHVTHDPTEVLPCEKHILELCPGETPMYRIIKK